MSDEPTPTDREETRMRHLLGIAGVQVEPTSAQLIRWRGILEAELAAAAARRRARRLAAFGGAVAALAALWLMLIWLPSEVPSGNPAVAEVGSTFGGVVVVDEGGEVVRLVAEGDRVFAGERVRAGERSGLGVRYAGGDVRLDARTLMVFDEHRLVLVHGTAYIDSGTSRASVHRAIRVQTPVGVITHVGTQFVVQVGADEVIAAVREGAIALRDQGRERAVAASSNAARMLVVALSGEIREEEVDSRGELWSWALKSSAGITLEGRSADEVLQWAAREQGRRVEYAHAQARSIARQARLGGGRRAVGPLEAMKLVEAATRLRIEIAESGAVFVTVSSEGDEHAE